MIRSIDWQRAASAALLLLSAAFLLNADWASLRWTDQLSAEGSPRPAIDAASPTGYALGQRHFLGVRNRGETYRWIAFTQELAASGPFSAETYHGDNAPTGRPQLLPKLYAGYLAAIAYGIHAATDLPYPIAVERAALWEPLLSHLIVFLLFVALVAKRLPLPVAAVAALLFSLFPFFSAQFIPGSLSPEPLALFLASFALLSVSPATRNGRTPIHGFGPSSAIFAGLALWLDPTYGFPAVLLLAAVGFAQARHAERPLPFLTWAACGSAIALAGWLIDRNPIALQAGELRYNHPLYPLSWAGIGLALHAWQRRRHPQDRRAAWLLLAAGLSLGLALPIAQMSRGYLGWLYSGANMRRPTSLDESAVFDHAFAWMAQATPAESLFFFLLPTLAFIATALAFRRDKEPAIRIHSTPTLIVLGGLFLLACFKLRWGIALNLVAIPVLAARCLRLPHAARLFPLVGTGAVLFAFFAWGRQLPASLQRPADDAPLARPDLEALVHRHLAHWMATHYPTRDATVLASPELSDALVFHGSCQTLLSTAWESYPGQVAASRILSAPEDSEVQAVLESREITHLILPSWDRVIPLLVRKPATADDDTFYDRLQRWLLPLYLRPVPYQLPPVLGFESEKLAIFKMTAPQDDALAMSRLAEYFLEMRRPEPAVLAAETLADSFPRDPNSRIAQALVYADAKQAAAFHQQLSELIDNTRAGRVPLDWDRRVQRAVTLALGKQSQLARKEVGACLETMDEESLYQLTALQTFQLLRLAALFELDFPQDSLRELALLRCSEYLPE